MVALNAGGHRGPPLHYEFTSEEVAMASKKTIIAENVQKCLDQSDWKAAIIEMEKLFAIDRDPHVRVRIGDARRKLNLIRSAIREYLHAADLFVENGFVVKGLAQYNLALRLDSSNTYARTRVDMLKMLRPGRAERNLASAPMEYRAPQPFASATPHYSHSNEPGN